MKSNALIPLAALIWFGFLTSTAAITRYVDATSTAPSPPYTSWAIAATNIQDAINAAVSGDEIIVTNGIYATGGYSATRVGIDKAVTVRSVNGPLVTFINGGGTVRCVSITLGATLLGFTLTNGFTPNSGGGVDGPMFSTAIVQNCIITGNRVDTNGVFSTGGGAAGCTLNNCLIVGNRANSGGGTYFCSMNNCTIVSNTAFYSGGGSYSTNGSINNTILYYNSPDNWAGSAFRTGPAAQSYCCTTPDPFSGPGNITNAPLFADLLAGNFRLQSNSPCINAGNNTYAVGPTDLGGGPRIVGGTVDIGAYEFQPMPGLRIALSSSLVTLAWPLWASNFVLQQVSNVPTAEWSNVAASVNPTPTENVVTLSLKGATKFFRLRSP